MAVALGSISDGEAGGRVPRGSVLALSVAVVLHQDVGGRAFRGSVPASWAALLVVLSGQVAGSFGAQNLPRQ